MIYAITAENGIPQTEGFESLQEAIGHVNSRNGGTLQLYPPGGVFSVEGLSEHMTSGLPPLKAPITLEGNGCTLQGEGMETGLLVEASGCTIRNLTFAGYSHGLWIRPKEKEPIMNTLISDCTFQDMRQTGLLTGSDQDYTGTDGLVVERCRFTTELSNRKDAQAEGMGPFAGIFAAALALDHPREIQGSFLKNVSVRDCVVEGTKEREFMEGIFFTCAYDYSYGYVSPEKLLETPRSTACELVMKDIAAVRNRFSNVFDGSLFALITSSDIHSEGCSAEGITFSDNHIVFGLAGMGINGLDLYGFGTNGCHARNNSICGCTIEKNELIATKDWKGEDISAIKLETALHENGICTSDNCRMEQIVVKENTIKGGEAGIQLFAARAFADETRKSESRFNSLENIRILKNHFEDNETAITIYAARLDGRSDFPPMHDLNAAVEETSHGFYAHGNVIKDVFIAENRSIGTKLFLQEAGAMAAGHSLAAGNRVLNVALGENAMEKGRLTYFYETLIQDQILYEEASGEGNQAELTR